jgi:hypothetical protein
MIFSEKFSEFFFEFGPENGSESELTRGGVKYFGFSSKKLLRGSSSLAIYTFRAT